MLASEAISGKTFFRVGKGAIGGRERGNPFWRAGKCSFNLRKSLSD